MTKYFKVVIIVLVFSSSFIFSQQRAVQFYLGGYFGLNYNNHIASFNKLDEKYANCCPKFKSADGSGLSIGGLFEKNINKQFSWGLKFGFSQLDGTFSPKEIIGNTEVREEAPPHNTILVQRAEVEHYLASKLFTLGAEPYISYNIFDRLNSIVGLRLSYLYLAEFSQKEKILRPNNVTFINGSRIRNEFNNEEIPAHNAFQLFGNIGISYDLKIGANSFMSPAVNFYIPFTNISKVDWKVNTVQFALNLKF
ncbi:MAG TPA: hypothetical protein PLU67_10865, partial [Candidatus Kapabacteria bacterium]|nr:hypothetical protein [Candidatus Kapabacteria bacterium]